NNCWRTASSPRPAGRGGCASKEESAKPPNRRRRGGGSGSKAFLLIVNHHPVRSIKGSFAIFLLMSRPPLLARRGHRLSDETSTSSTQKSAARFNKTLHCHA